MKMKTSKFGLGAILAAGALLLTSCAAPGADDAQAAGGDAKGAVKATLMLNWTPNAHHAGIYYAQEHGLYAEQGIDLEIIEPGADLGVEAAVAQDSVQFGISQAESLLPAREAGIDAVAIGTLLPINDSALMGLSGSGLTADPKSLDGLRYGGYGGALETEIISGLVSCAGGDPKSIDFVDIGNVDYLAGLEQSRFDVTWVFEGWDALRAKSERDDVVTIPFADHQDCIPNWYTPILVTSDQLATGDPELVRGFLAATAAGYDAVASDPAAGSDALLKAAPELNEQLVKDAVAYYAPLYGTDAGFGTMDESTWKGFTDYLVQAGLIKSSDALIGAWTDEFLPQQS